MNTIKEGDFITIAVGEHECRCLVDTVFAPIGQLPKYFVKGISLPFLDWVGIDDIITTKNRTTYRIGSKEPKHTVMNSRSMWHDILNKQAK